MTIIKSEVYCRINIYLFNGARFSNEVNTAIRGHAIDIHTPANIVRTPEIYSDPFHAMANNAQ